MGIPTGFSVGMGWVWELKSNSNCSPAIYIYSFKLFTKNCGQTADLIELPFCYSTICDGQTNRRQTHRAKMFYIMAVARQKALININECWL